MPLKFLPHGLKILAGWLAEVLYFPIWWYTAGWFKLGRRLSRFVGQEWQAWSIGVWAKNLLVPMYGQRDIGSRLISIMMRLVQIVFRLTAWTVLAIVLLLVWLSWPLWPLAIAGQFLFQLL